MGKWSHLNHLIDDNKNMAPSPLAWKIIEEKGLDSQFQNSIRHHIRRYRGEYKKNVEHNALKEYCEQENIPYDPTMMYWHKGKLKGNNISVLVGAKKEEGLSLEDVEKTVLSALDGYNKIKPKAVKDTNKKALRLIVSDIHVGLDPNPSGNSLFGYEYNADIFNERLDVVYQEALKKYKSEGAFEVLFLDDLGDALDGYNNQTTRGGHHLPQNLSNVEAFMTYVEGKYKLIRRLVEARIAKKYVIRNVGNCNHAGEFGVIANKTIELMTRESLIAKVKYHTFEKFVEHFFWGDHCWLLTHGKDKEHMKFGFPLQLNDKTINWIREYIDGHNITSKYIHVDKGDLHQIGYNRTKKFDYTNFMSFAPPSGWAQHNFADSYCGFSIQIIKSNSGNISQENIFF